MIAGTIAARPRRTAPSPALAYGAAAIASLLALWFAATAIPGVVDDKVLPSPVAVVLRFATLAVDTFSGSTLFGHAAASLARWLIGVAVAVGLGVPLGVLLAWLPPFRPAVTPVFELFRYIPPFAWVPIAVLWFGASTTTQAAIVFIAAFPACVINTQLGVAQVDSILLRAAKTLGAGAATTLSRVVLPVAAPAIFTGIRIAFSNGWISACATARSPRSRPVPATRAAPWASR